MSYPVMYATTLEWIGGTDEQGITLEQHAEEVATKHGVTFASQAPSQWNLGNVMVTFTSEDPAKLKALYLDGGPGDFEESWVVAL